MSKLSSLPRFAPKALQLALAAGVLSLATAQGAMAQEKVLRIAMTAGDIPRTSGQPDQGFEGPGLPAARTPDQCSVALVVHKYRRTPRKLVG